MTFFETKKTRAGFPTHIVIVAMWGLFAVMAMSVCPNECRAQSSATPATSTAPPAESTSADTSSASESGNTISSRRLLEVVRNGGPLMIPIGICSFILLVFVFERAISLRKGRIIPRPFVRRIMHELQDGALDQDDALARCTKNKSPVAQVFAAGIKKWGKPSVEVEQALLDSGERTSNELRKYLRLINGVATVTPLLGLLGTVLGMIHAFDAIASVDPTQADPKMLIATGISQALLTTAAGMSVAIPAIIAHLYFVGRVDQRVMEIDQLSQKLVGMISADAIAARTPPPRTTRKKKQVA